MFLLALFCIIDIHRRTAESKDTVHSVRRVSQIWKLSDAEPSFVRISIFVKLSADPPSTFKYISVPTELLIEYWLARYGNRPDFSPHGTSAARTVIIIVLYICVVTVPAFATSSTYCVSALEMKVIVRRRSSDSPLLCIGICLTFCAAFTHFEGVPDDFQHFA